MFFTKKILSGNFPSEFCLLLPIPMYVWRTEHSYSSCMCVLEISWNCDLICFTTNNLMRGILSYLLYSSFAITLIFIIFQFFYLVPTVENPSISNNPPLSCILRNEKYWRIGENLISKFTTARNSSVSNCFTIGNDSSYVKSIFCYPSVVIMGFPKCGTSYLFMKLSKHPQIYATKRKELCLGGPGSENWDKFSSKLPSPEEVGDRFVMSGCLHLGANFEASSNLCVSNTKYIFVIRDVADMLFAAYNYWCIPNHDDNCLPGHRTLKGSKRTVNHFHELITNSSSLGGGLLFSKDGTCYRTLLEQAVQSHGRQNIFVMKSESMQSTSHFSERNNSFMKLTKFLSISFPSNQEWYHEVAFIFHIYIYRYS